MRHNGLKINGFQFYLHMVQDLKSLWKIILKQKFGGYRNDTFKILQKPG